MAIVGGGPAGLAAAVELRRQGVARVLLLEREGELGGIPRHCHHLGFGWLDLRRLLSGPSYARRWASRVRAAGVEAWTEASVTRWAAPRALQVATPRGLVEVSARAVLLATGCRERPRAARLVPGARPAGVLTTGSLQQLVHLSGLRAGRRAVVVGAEHVSFSAAHTLKASGTEVAALVTDLPRHQTYAPLAWLAAGRYGVPVLADSQVAAILGRTRVEAVEVRHRSTGALTVIACDTVVFTGDWIPDHELARAAGLAMDPGTRGPRVDLSFRTSSPGVFAAGNLLHGAEAAGVAALDGQASASAIARFLREGAWPAEPALAVRVTPPLKWVAPNALAAPGDPAVRPFVLRVAAFLRDATVEVRQDARTLYRRRFRELVPNRSISLSAAWAERVTPGGGEVVVSATARSQDGTAA